jgi:hypothetical protein
MIRCVRRVQGMKNSYAPFPNKRSRSPNAGSAEHEPENIIASHQ